MKYISNKFKIKWPNDIYVGNRKMGGVLIENTLSPNFLPGFPGLGRLYLLNTTLELAPKVSFPDWTSPLPKVKSAVSNPSGRSISDSVPPTL